MLWGRIFPLVQTLMKGRNDERVKWERAKWQKGEMGNGEMAKGWNGKRVKRKLGETTKGEMGRGELGRGWNGKRAKWKWGESAKWRNGKGQNGKRATWQKGEMGIKRGWNGKGRDGKGRNGNKPWIALRQLRQTKHRAMVYWFGMARMRHSRPCRPLFLSRGMPIPSDFSDFPLDNSCGNGAYVFEISWMCMCLPYKKLYNKLSGVECGKIEFLRTRSCFDSIFRQFCSLIEKRFQCESLLPSRSEPV
jgi:hypothetical protein